MAKDLWFDRFGEVLTSVGTVKHAAPVTAAGADAAAVTVRPFGPFDAGGGAWQFSTGLRFEMPAASPAKALVAMAPGTMRFVAGTAGAPGRVVLARGDLPTTAVARAGGALPAWYPPVKLIVYDNVDPAAAKAAALAALGNPGERKRALARLRKGQKKPDLKATEAELADRWMADEIPDGIGVAGAAKVGACGAAAAAGRVEATVRLVESIDPAPTRFWNPAFLLALWDASSWITSGNDLFAQQSDTGGPMVATGRLVFVAKAGTDTAPYDTPAKASTTIAAAIGAATAGDSVLIVDTGTYAEALTITKPICLTSISAKKATDPTPGYPTISGANANRPILIRNVANGVAHVSRLKITAGAAKHGTDHGVGGGILVDRVHSAVISSCHIHGNHSQGGGIFSEGYGGGIGCYHASPAIAGCLIESNHAQGRGSGIGSWGYGWPSIFDCTIRQNTPLGGGNTPTPNDPLARNLRGDGGGVAITVGVNRDEDPSALVTTTAAALPTRWDSANLARARANHVRIVRCRVTGNSVGDDGGGLYVSIASNVRVIATDILNNSAAGNGGGVRVTMRSELRVRGGRIANNSCNSGADPNANFGGGGISSRNTTLLELRGVTIEDNQSRGFAGGGVYFISSDEGDILRDWTWVNLRGIPTPGFDWNNVLLTVFGFRGAELSLDSSCRVRRNRAQVLPGRSSGDPGKGGGLYALRFSGTRTPTRPPADRVTPTIDGQPLTVAVADVDSLAPNNVSSFADAARLYIDDMVVAPRVVRTDTDLPATGELRYP